MVTSARSASSRDPACEATPAPSAVTVIVGRVLIGCTFEVPSPLGNCWRRNLQSSLLRGHFVYRPPTRRRQLHEEAGLVSNVKSRELPDPTLLKPSPHLIKLAIQVANIPPVACVMVGDSVSDFAAARSAGVVSIGYSSRFEKSNILRTASPGPTTVVDHMIQFRLVGSHLSSRS